MDFGPYLFLPHHSRALPVILIVITKKILKKLMLSTNTLLSFINVVAVFKFYVKVMYFKNPIGYLELPKCTVHTIEG